MNLICDIYEGVKVQPIQKLRIANNNFNCSSAISSLIRRIIYRMNEFYGFLFYNCINISQFAESNQFDLFLGRSRRGNNKIGLLFPFPLPPPCESPSEPPSSYHSTTRGRVPFLSSQFHPINNNFGVVSSGECRCAPG